MPGPYLILSDPIQTNLDPNWQTLLHLDGRTTGSILCPGQQTAASRSGTRSPIDASQLFCRYGSAGVLDGILACAPVFSFIEVTF